MKFQAFHVNPGEKLKKKDVNNDLSNFMSVFPIVGIYNFEYFEYKKLHETHINYCTIFPFLAYCLSSCSI